MNAPVERGRILALSRCQLTRKHWCSRRYGAAEEVDDQARSHCCNCCVGIGTLMR